MEAYFTEHVKDLSKRSEDRGIFTFTAFLTPEEQSEILRRRRELTAVAFFGGTEGAERCVARFGDPEVLGYDQPWEIVCLKIAPRGMKFADALTHRDVLGALMHTGITRDRLGDILLRDNTAYVFTDPKTAGFLAEEVTQIKHTSVDAALCDEVPADARKKTEAVEAIAASLRLDCVLGAVYHLSRGGAAELLRMKKVFINGEECENASRPIREGDVISVRGYGKFRFAGETGRTKKDRVAFLAEKYV